ncbi:MAG: hydroxyacid dehydrogenase [Chitinophagaceae bacterium]|nr:hydroxyacid dehydrogenase [Chitinophagaceae bacterium]
MPKVILAASISESFQQFLLSKNYELDMKYNNPDSIAQAEGIITSTKLIINKDFINQAKNLKWIARLGSGLEIIDTEYAASKNIFCCNSPAGIANAVAEHVIALIINLQKNIVKSARQVQQYLWIREENRGVELEGKTIGIIGFGHTGIKVAEKLSVFGCNIIAYDKYKIIQHPFVKNVSLQELYLHSDIVSFHVPLTAGTTNYYNADLFAKPHVVINTSRGKVAFTEAIIKGFQSNQIIAAGLDVLDFENEYPFSVQNIAQLASLKNYNCIITPHIAGYSFNAIQKMCAELQKKLELCIFNE